MIGSLTRERFDPTVHLHLVQSFKCGSEPYQLVSSNWIKGVDSNDSIIADIQSYGTDVWLYKIGSQIVGFASLGVNNWSTEPKGARLPVVIIPHIAVDEQFWGVPPDNPYADQILDDVRQIAATTWPERGLLALAVSPANRRAQRFYERNGLAYITPQKDGHLRMVIANRV